MYTFQSRKGKRFILLVALFVALIYCMEGPSGNLRELQEEDNGKEETKTEDSKDIEEISSTVDVDTAEDNLNEKPLMHTFYEPNGSCCGMTLEGHQNLVKAWEESWQARGWDTKVLTKADAVTHPDFEKNEQLLKSFRVGEYNRRCFWRWMAMAMVGGGWMTDYDTFPITLDAEKGLEISKEPGFKSYSLHVPNVIHAPPEAWDRVLQLMLKTLPDDPNEPPDYILPTVTDMFALQKAESVYSRDDMMITVWENGSTAFFYKKVEDENDPLEIDCELAKKKKVAHLSHYDTHQAWKKYHTYPKFEGVTRGNFIERRGEAALVLLKDFKEQCLDGETEEPKEDS